MSRTKRFYGVLAACAALALAGCNQQDSTAGSDQAASFGQKAAPTAPPFVAPGEEVGSVILTPAGYGAYLIGGELPEEAVPADKADAKDIAGTCTLYKDPKIEGLLVEVDQSKIIRLIVLEPSTIETGAGIKIGSLAEDVRAGYQQLLEAPRPNGKLVVNLYAGDVDKGALRFEIAEDGKVAALYAGRDPYLSGVNTCE